MMDIHFLLDRVVALGQVVMIDLVLAGDNAIVVGMAAAGLPREVRGKVILVGIATATVMRVLFALAVNRIMIIVGLTLAGGLLLLWVCWKFWRELHLETLRRTAQHANGDVETAPAETEVLPGFVPKTMLQAIAQIVIADVSMSLDNVLAVAGAAEDHTWVMAIGLLLSVGLMGAAATLIASLLKRHHWIAYVGLAIILWVALDMVYRGSTEVLHEVASHSSSALRQLPNHMSL
jgi:YjbE family integral membrane protein